MTELILDHVTQLPWPLCFSEAALRAILAEGRRADPLESCGVLFGKPDLPEHWVHLVSPAGPRAIRERHTVERDHHWQFRWEDRLYLVDMVIRGLWHSHPFQVEPGPSPQDLHGWKRYDEERFDGAGHLEVIVGRSVTRCYLVRLRQAKIWLVRRWPYGLDRRTGVPR